MSSIKYIFGSSLIPVLNGLSTWYLISEMHKRLGTVTEPVVVVPVLTLECLEWYQCTACLIPGSGWTLPSNWCGRPQEEAFLTFENTMVTWNSSTGTLCIDSVCLRQIINLVLFENWNGAGTMAKMACCSSRVPTFRPSHLHQVSTTSCKPGSGGCSTLSWPCAHVCTWKKHTHTEKAWKLTPK